MKYAVLIILSLSLSMAFSQMSIHEGQFENGLTYPILSDRYDSTKFELINADLLKGLKDLEESPYCISDYGYVHKGSHIQLQIMCTCMEMDHGELRFFFYNLDTGKPVPYSDLFESKSREQALAKIDEKISEHIKNNPNKCSESLKALGEHPNFDDLNVRLTRDGLEIRAPKDNSCENAPIKLTWSELKEYLRYKFI